MQLDVEVSPPASATNHHMSKIEGRMSQRCSLRYELFSSLNFGQITDRHMHRCAQKGYALLLNGPYVSQGTLRHGNKLMLALICILPRLLMRSIYFFSKMSGV